MKTSGLKKWLHPFRQIAGYEALGWGLAGLIVSTALCYFLKWHYHGLLHFGPAPNNVWWCYLVEHLTVWLLPATVFYLGGLIFSRSRIRPVDVFGTVLFAEVLLTPMALFHLIPPVRDLANMRIVPGEIPSAYQLTGIWLMLVASVFVVGCMIWLFHALQVSCNLKGWKLWCVYLLGTFGADVACRYIIGIFY